MVVIILSMPNRVKWRMNIRKQIQTYNEKITVSDLDHTWTTGSFQKNHLASRLQAKMAWINFSPFFCLSAVKPLFLIGSKAGMLPEQEANLSREIQYHQDILLSSREEDYYKTAYKVLGAYIWVQWYKLQFKDYWQVLLPWFIYFQFLSCRQIHSQNWW